jgi:predicted ATPase
MKRFVLTGTPGSGKTAIVRQLELDGFGVVEEAATDVIALEQARGVAEPWKHPTFIDSIVELQRQRLVRASGEPDEIQFHDRSAVCTAALAVYLGYARSEALSRELGRMPRRCFGGKSSSSRAWVSSRRPTRGGSASRRPCVLSACMKISIAISASS